MKRMLLLATIGGALVSGALSTELSAATITFVTLGNLSCGGNATCIDGIAGDNMLTFASTLIGGPSLTVVYNPGGDTQNAPPAASANFGSISLVCGGCTTANNAAWDLNGFPPMGVITFNQSAPFVGSNTLSGGFSSVSLGWSGLSGTSGAQTGTARFLFGPVGMSIIGGASETVTYTVEQPVAGTLLQLGANSIQGTVNYSQATVPEPSTFALLGLGGCALGYLRRQWMTRG